MSPAFAGLLAVLLIHACLLICSGGCSTDGQQATQKEQSPMSSPEIPEFTRLRERMVHDQLRARDISDPRVLASMSKVPRHEFVPADLVRQPITTVRYHWHWDRRFRSRTLWRS